MATEFAADVGVGIGGRLLMKTFPPAVVCGSPVQRAKDKDESWWHIPITIRASFPLAPDVLPDCTIWAELFNGTNWADKIAMRWGDIQSEDPVNRTTLRVGDVRLVPVVWRQEGDDQSAYLTNDSYFRKQPSKWKCPPDRKKRRLRLLVTSGSRDFLDRGKSTFVIRVPFESSNGHFTLEREFQSRGSSPVAFEFVTKERNGAR